MKQQDAHRRCLITGAASGIGRHLAGRLLAAGHRVLATDIELEVLSAHAAQDDWPQDRLLLRQLDVRQDAAWQAALDDLESRWGGLDVLLNVAGYLRPGEVVQATPQDFDRHFDINVKGVGLGTAAAAQHMLANGAGHIINFASLASLAPVPGLALYSASKYAVRAFSLAAAQELAPHGIAVTAICPDAVATPMLDLQLDYEEAALTFSGPRILTVEDVSRAVLGPILRRRPLLYILPRSRGWLARLADLFPGLSNLLAGSLTKKGLKRQAQLRRDR